MNNQNLSYSHSDGAKNANTLNPAYSQTLMYEKGQSTSFWHMRIVEGGLILSMALYYLVGNPNIHIGSSHLPWQNLNPHYSLPFLLIFAILAWSRFSVAIALLPLSLPYYYIQKNVTQSLRFSL